MPKISVIIPVYNTGKYLSRCLDSIINQTFNNLEIICINDGSTDNSATILEKYATKDKRIKIITQENSGLSATRNVGLKNMSGQYVSFIDSDDWIDADYYETLLNLIEQNNADIVMAGMRIANDKKISDNNTPNIVTDDFVQKVKNLPNGSSCDKLFRAKLFKNLKFPIDRYYEDNVVLLQVMYNSDTVVFTNRVSYYYFVNNSGICRTTNEKIVKKREQDRLYSAKQMMDFAKKHGFGQSREIKDFIVRTVIVDFILKKSPYYAQAKKILGWGYVFAHNNKKLLVKIGHIFYQNNSRLRILRIPIYKWKKK